MAADIANEGARLRSAIEARLRGSVPGGDPFLPHMMERSAADLAALREFLPTQLSRAAVLVPVVERDPELTVLLTRRASHLKHHAGQVSFPGGRIEAGDPGPWEAALREAEEEIGLRPEYVRLAGYLSDHFVITGYVVTPVVAFVRPGFSLKLDLTEVEEAFEVPLSFVLDRANHVPRERHFAGRTFKGYDIPYQDHNIWGATAVMLMSLCRLLEQP
jgi:8-oxo-dGTP pyrophosphatase MutT (NUDIX family)